MTTTHATLSFVSYYTELDNTSDPNKNPNGTEASVIFSSYHNGIGEGSLTEEGKLSPASYDIASSSLGDFKLLTKLDAPLILASGMDAFIWINETTQEAVVSFRGSEGSILGPGTDHIDAFFAMQASVSLQETIAENLYDHVINELTLSGYDDFSLSATGHSLGGMLAEEFSSGAPDGVDVPVYAYNSPSSNQTWLSNTNIENHEVTYTDPFFWGFWGENIHGSNYTDFDNTEVRFVTGSFSNDHSMAQLIDNMVTGDGVALTPDAYLDYYAEKMMNGSIFSNEFNRALDFLTTVKDFVEPYRSGAINYLKEALDRATYIVNVDSASGIVDFTGFDIEFRVTKTGSRDITVALEDHSSIDYSLTDFEGGISASRSTGLQNVVSIEGSINSDQMEGVDAIHATSYDDSFRDVAFSEIYALAGDDNLKAGNESNFFDGGSGIDYIDYSDLGRIEMADGTVKKYYSSSATVHSSEDNFENVEKFNLTSGSDVFYAKESNEYHLTSDVIDVDHLSGFWNHGEQPLNSLIWAGGGYDTVVGEQGHDVIFGGSGGDIINGAGSGIDLLVGDAGHDIIIGRGTIYGGEHNDLIEGDGVVYGGAGIDYINGSHIESADYSAMAEFHGGAGNDYLNAGDAYNSSFDPGTGNDVMSGGEGYSVYNYSSSDISAGIGRDTITNFKNGHTLILNGLTLKDVSAHYSGSDTVITIKGNSNSTITLKNRHIDIQRLNDSEVAESTEAIYQELGYLNIGGGYSSGTGDDIKNGTSGVDIIDAESGNDTIYGGGNTDFLYGGQGDDRLWGQDGNDRLFGDAGHDHFKGGSGNDYIWGGSGNDVIHGEDGKDFLFGGYGDDTYVLTDNLDTIVETRGNGYDQILVDFDGDVTIPDFVERAVMRGENDVIHGNSMDNAIWGTDGDNVIYGGAGDDAFKGKGGNDVIYGGSGNDRLDGDGGSNQLYGGKGDDVFIIRNSGDQAIEHEDEGYDASYISFIGHTNLGDHIEKGVLYESSGASSLTGNTSDNWLQGNAQDNQISGNAGADTLWGRAGNDILTGGLGADTFIFDDVTGGVDRITDFESGVDVCVVGKLIGDEIPGLDGSSLLSGGHLIATENGTDLEIYVNKNSFDGDTEEDRLAFVLEDTSINGISDYDFII